MNTIKKITSHFLFRISTAILTIYSGLILLKVVINPLLTVFGIADENLIRMLRFSICIPAIFFFYILYFRVTEKREITEFKADYKGILLGLTTASLIILCSLGILLISENYLMERQPVDISKILYPIVILLFLVILEEIIFRGIIYRILRENAGMIKALVFSAVLFAVPHFFNFKGSISGMLSALLGGILLCLLYEYRRNIWITISFHYSWNLTQVLLGLTLSGSDEFTKFVFLRTVSQGNSIITGGKFGIESSLPVLVFLFMAIAFFYTSFKDRMK